MNMSSLEENFMRDHVGDMLSTPIMKKESVLERLNKRNKDRQNYLDVKLEQRNKENLQLEGEDYFMQAFGQRTREIQTRIENINEAANKKPNCEPVAKAELTRLLTDITMEIQELQRYVTNSTMFLTDFRVKSCQNIVSELTHNLDETRSRLMPKKKFGFSSKNNIVKESVEIDKVDSPVNKKLNIPNKVFDWTLSDRQDEYICLRGNEVNGRDLTISNLNNCFVELQGHAGSLQICDATHCTLLCGPISRSLFAENCEDCTITAACQQLRLHSSINCRIYLHVTCRAIIEDCKKIELADYNYSYPEMDIDFKKSELSRENNNYKDVADFNWLSTDVPSPNWKLMQSNTKPDWYKLRQKFKESLISSDNKLL